MSLKLHSDCILYLSRVFTRYLIPNTGSRIKPQFMTNTINYLLIHFKSDLIIDVHLDDPRLDAGLDPRLDSTRGHRLDSGLDSGLDSRLDPRLDAGLDPRLDSTRGHRLDSGLVH